MWPGPDPALCSPHRLCPLCGFGGCSLLPGLPRVRKSAGTDESGPSVDGAGSDSWPGKSLLSHLPTVPEACASHWSSHFPQKPRTGRSGRLLPLYCARDTQHHPKTISDGSHVPALGSVLVLGKLLPLRSSWNPPQPFGVVVLPPTLRQLEHREVEKLAQGHSASE